LIIEKYRIYLVSRISKNNVMTISESTYKPSSVPLVPPVANENQWSFLWTQPRDWILAIYPPLIRDCEIRTFTSYFALLHIFYVLNVLNKLWLFATFMPWK